MFTKPAALSISNVAVLAALACGGLVTAAEKPWLEVRSPNFVVIGNTGEGDGRDVAWQFEQVRVAFQLIWPWARRESGRSFVVFALRSESDLRALAPEFWEKGRDGASAVAVRGSDKDYFALRSGLATPDDVRTNPYFYAYWGYATQMLQANYPGRLPPWYQRGLADFFANTLVKKQQVELGRIIDHHVRSLGQGPRMSLAEILGVDWQSPWLTDGERLRTFDAHAWMLVHYLTLGENRTSLPKFNRFAELLKQGVPADSAFAQAMGDVAAVGRGFERYIGHLLYTFVAFNTDVNIKPSGFSVRPLSPSDSLALRAGFHVAMSRPSEARALLAEARRAEPRSILADEVEGPRARRGGAGRALDCRGPQVHGPRASRCRPPAGPHPGALRCRTEGRGKGGGRAVARPGHEGRGPRGRAEVDRSHHARCDQRDGEPRGEDCHPCGGKPGVDRGRQGLRRRRGERLWRPGFGPTARPRGA